MSESDLKHRDWLLFSMKSIIQSTDESISIFIEDRPDGGKVLRATTISEKTIGNLPFITNTDQNNNYLYLEDLMVYIDGHIAPLEVPGLKDVAIEVYRKSDINAFLQYNRTHFPFSINSYKGLNFNEFVDQYTALQPTTLNTTGYVKTYEIVINPDLTANRFISGSKAFGSGYVAPSQKPL